MSWASNVQSSQDAAPVSVYVNVSSSINVLGRLIYVDKRIDRYYVELLHINNNLFHF